MTGGPVLVSWLAQARDPAYMEKGETRNGPTWTVLCDPQSNWRGEIRDAVIFHHARDLAIARKTEAHVHATDPGVRFHLRAWDVSTRQSASFPTPPLA